MNADPRLSGASLKWLLDTRTEVSTTSELRSLLRQRRRFAQAENATSIYSRSRHMRTKDHLESEAERNIRHALITIMDLRLRAGSSKQELRSFVGQCVTSAIRDHRPSEA